MKILPLKYRQQDAVSIICLQPLENQIFQYYNARLHPAAIITTSLTCKINNKWQIESTSELNNELHGLRHSGYFKFQKCTIKGPFSGFKKHGYAIKKLVITFPNESEIE